MIIRNCLLLIICLSIAVILSPPASANTTVISQGDTIYWNETVDISLAGSWPTYQVAWCSPDDDVCDPPDIVIQLKGNLHQYYMDPTIFTHYGDYYRWDGTWHKNEYSLAFKYKPGARPTEPKNLTNTSNLVGSSHPITYGPFKWVIARGDDPDINLIINRTDICHLWIWTNTVEFYDIPLQNNNSTYYVQFTKEQTMNITPGTYHAYLQFNGNNGIQDIQYDEGYDLITPYNTHLVKEVSISPLDIGNARLQFDQYIPAIPYYDDVIIPVEVDIENPSIVVTYVQQEPDKLYISGVTSWKDNTSMSLTLDPDQYPIALDRERHTWTSWSSGGSDALRTFTTALDISASDLSKGPHHIDMKADKDPLGPVSSYDFLKTDVYVMPTPTPQWVSLLTDINGNPIPTPAPPVTSSITPNQTPEQPVVSSVVVLDDNGNATVNSTVSNVTEVHLTPGPVTPTPNDPNIRVPVPIWIPLAAILYIVMRKRE